MVSIGIVGGVASGKSLVASQLESLGARRIDVDRLGHEVLTDPNVKSALVGRWGPSVLNVDGEIDRRAVAAIVFAQNGNQELEFLERITHPRIADRIRQTLEDWTQQGVVRVALLDAAVLLKAGWDVFCDKILYVDTPRPLRLERALARNWTQAQFDSREAAQRSLDSKRERADWVVDNSGSPEDTRTQLQAIWQSIVSPSPQHKP